MSNRIPKTNTTKKKYTPSFSNEPKASDQSSVEGHIFWALEYQKEVASRSDYEWSSTLWNFLRLVKAHPAMIDLQARPALMVIEGALFDCGGCWGKKTPHTNHWLQLSDAFESRWDADLSFDDDWTVRIELTSVWEKIRCPYGWNPLDLAFRRADQTPLAIPDRCDMGPGYAHFLSIAGWLQVAQGDDSILLPCEELANRLRCEARTVSRYRQRAEADGFLIVVRQHAFRSGGSSRATEFRFATDRFTELV